MKMASYCYSCILDRSLFGADLAGLAESEKKLAVEELLDYMACHKGGVSALVGTEREDNQAAQRQSRSIRRAQSREQQRGCRPPEPGRGVLCGKGG